MGHEIKKETRKKKIELNNNKHDNELNPICFS